MDPSPISSISSSCNLYITYNSVHFILKVHSKKASQASDTVGEWLTKKRQKNTGDAAAAP